MPYIYDTVQVPPNIEIKKANGNEAAIYLSRVLNQKASEGWEFQSVETIGVQVEPGCAEAFKGVKKNFAHYYVVVFRREVA